MRLAVCKLGRQRNKNHHSGNRIRNLITVQQDATVFSLLHLCRQLYMFGVLTPIIGNLYNYNYSFWY